MKINHSRTDLELSERFKSILRGHTPHPKSVCVGAIRKPHFWFSHDAALLWYNFDKESRELQIRIPMVE